MDDGECCIVDVQHTRHSIEEKLKISFAHFQQCSSIALNGSKPFDLIYKTAAVSLTKKYLEKLLTFETSMHSTYLG